MSAVGKGLSVTTEELTGQRIMTKTGQWLFILAILAAITVTEWVFAYKDVAYGIGLALFVTIGIYLVISLTRWGQSITNCAESLVLIPLYILFTSSLPWFFINQQYLLPAVYSAIIALCLWHVYQKKLSLREIFGFVGAGGKLNSAFFSRAFKFLLMGIFIGIPVGVAEYFVIHPAPAFPAFEVKYLFRDMFYMFCFVGLAEELLFRGLVQRDLMKAFGWKQGIFLASVTFAVMHLTWRSIPELGFVFVVGLILGYVYYRTKSLVGPIIIHGAGNVVLVGVMPYLFS